MTLGSWNVHLLSTDMNRSISSSDDLIVKRKTIVDRGYFYSAPLLPDIMTIFKVIVS